MPILLPVVAVQVVAVAEPLYPPDCMVAELEPFFPSFLSESSWRIERS